MTRMIIVSFVIAGFMIAGVVMATSLQGQDRDSFLRLLRSDNWEQRAEAFNKLNLTNAAIESAEVKSALVDLLERENLLVETTLQESGGQVGVSAKYGEKYSEYYSHLLGIVESIADQGDTRVLSVLVRSAYSPESPFALKLARRGEEVIPILIDLSESTVSITRGRAFTMLGQVATRLRSKISGRALTQIRETLARGSSDKDDDARKQAIQALSKIDK